MVKNDTIELLKECNAGVKMGVSSIDEVLPDVKNAVLRKKLTVCKDEHEKLFKQIHIYDNSFLLLKQQLEKSLNNTTTPSTLPFSNIFLEKTNNVEKTLNKLKPSIKKY